MISLNGLNGGYAMIKYNSTQEELQIAYKSKKPVLCYDENRRAHWAVIEETATESVDEETQEPITIYEYSYRLLDEASGGGATLDDIVDSQGNKRFVEGNGTPKEITGVTNVYCRWSLSGTHLMLVYAGTMTGALESQDFCVFSVPQWILDKIYPMRSDGFIDKKNMPLYHLTADSSTSGDIYLYKTDEGLKIYLAISFNRSQVYGFRAQFDLLIDAE